MIDKVFPLKFSDRTFYILSNERCSNKATGLYPLNQGHYLRPRYVTGLNISIIKS